MLYADELCSCTEEGDNYIFNGKCGYCEEDTTVKAPKDAVHKCRAGTWIEEAMPMLSIGEMDFILNGLCPTCHKEIFEED
jgi:hypothetical protein